MKNLILIAAIILSGLGARAQTVITAADMPAPHDILSYHTANIIGTNINLYDSGTNKTWDYSGLSSLLQQADTFLLATSINSLYGLTAPAGCYGYKVADSIPGLGALLPVSIKQLYTFFNLQSSPSSYAAVAFGATADNFPIASAYTAPDNWYFFPLSYGRRDSSGFSLTISIPSFGGIKENGYRITTADGYGTVKTPFYTTAINCLRVRSDIHQVDSINYSGFNIGIPVNTVEYKWLVNGQHYPALWVTTIKTGNTETITNITYADSARVYEGLPTVKTAAESLMVYPNPAVAGKTKIDVPASWGNYIICIYDIPGREMLRTFNQNEVDLAALPAGQYLARITGINHVGYCVISR